MRKEWVLSTSETSSDHVFAFGDGLAAIDGGGGGSGLRRESVFHGLFALFCLSVGFFRLQNPNQNPCLVCVSVCVVVNIVFVFNFGPLNLLFCSFNHKI